jgi:hypothetical protein
MNFIAKFNSLLDRLNRHGEEYGFPFVRTLILIFSSLSPIIGKLIATTKSTKIHEIAHCIQAAIARYPFTSDEERKLIQVDLTHDFTFQGDDLMVTHVIFNRLLSKPQVASS